MASPRPDGLDGKSLRPLVEQPDAAWDKPALATPPRRRRRGWPAGRRAAAGANARPRPPIRGGVTGYSVRTELVALTEWNGGEQGRELYDHENDPGEMKNLADDPATRSRSRRCESSCRRRPRNWACPPLRSREVAGASARSIRCVKKSIAIRREALSGGAVGVRRRVERSTASSTPTPQYPGERARGSCRRRGGPGPKFRRGRFTHTAVEGEVSARSAHPNPLHKVQE